jgi:hypothetical protein
MWDSIQNIKTKSRKGKARQFHFFPCGSEPSIEKNKNVGDKFMGRKLNF